MLIHCLPVEVYRFPIGDCTNNGVSSRFDTLLVACSEGNRFFDPEKEIPINFCMVRWFRGIAQLVPATVTEDGSVIERPGWWMRSGNIADSCDSRWSELTGLPYPIHIHDRKEW